jgi:hypothetical protein
LAGNNDEGKARQCRAMALEDGCTVHKICLPIRASG